MTILATFAPLPDPVLGATRITVEPGATVAVIVAAAVPGAPAPESLRVTLTAGDRTAVVPPALWARVRPRPGTHVVIRSLPGEDGLRSVLLAVVSVAAVALGQFWASALIPTAGIGQTIVGGLLAGGLTVAGSLLVNALIPPPETEGRRGAQSYSIAGWRNEMRPGAPIPLVFGRIRHAPPFAATSWTEVAGDRQYVRALFCFGYGDLDISDIRIGDTPVTSYDDVQMEVRSGIAGDLPVSLYPRQVVEEALGVDLVRPLPRDATGAPTGGPGVETPVVRLTAADAAEVTLLIGFPGGLFRVNSEGEVRSRSVAIRIRQRLAGASTWSTVTTLDITARNREAFLRGHSWALPTRGRWEIEVTRMTDESTSTQVSDRTILSALQSIRPEYPIALGKPLALLAMRVKATFQLNGALEAVNAVVQRRGPVYSGGVWTVGLTRNPASAFLTALTGPANPWPVATSAIDLDQIADWFEWCEAKGLKYDRVHDQPETLGDMLRAICAAGRASPRHDGVRWGVVIDRPETFVVDHLSPRNAAGITWSRAYLDPPDGLRVRFRDETSGWEERERVVPWPGHVGPIDLTEELVLPGKTDPAEVWREARRRMHELIHRPDEVTLVQDGAARVATRGDLALVSLDALAADQRAARVLSIAGRLIEIDEEIDFGAGDYAVRYTAGITDLDTIGESRLRHLTQAPGPSRVLTVATDCDGLMPGAIVHVGPLASDSMPMRVRAVEPAEGFAARLTLVAAAPEIDTLTDAEVPPAWDGRVGDLVPGAPVAPGVPRVLSVATGLAGTDVAGEVVVLLAADAASAVATVQFQVDHRLQGAPSWTTILRPVASGGGSIPGYATGAAIELRFRALAADGTPGSFTATIPVTVGVNDAPLPVALDPDAISVAGVPGGIVVGFATGSDANTVSVQVYRSTSSTLNRATDAAGRPVDVAPFQSLSVALGDTARPNLISGGQMNDPAQWTAAGGWAIAGGVATKTAGAWGTLRQAEALVANAWYRVAFTVAGRTAGTVWPRFIGGTTRQGAAVTANGARLDRIQAAAGNTDFEFIADPTFNGSIDDVVMIRETAASLAQGTHFVWIEPLNGAGVPGPTAGPYSVTVV